MNTTTEYTENQMGIINPINGGCSAGSERNPGTTSQTKDKPVPFWRNLTASLKKSLTRAICSTGTCLGKLLPDQKDSFEKALEDFKAAEKEGATWKTLEVGKRFRQDDKNRMISEDTLVVGVDIACNKFNWRAFDKQGIELTSRAAENPMTREGIDSCLCSLRELAILNDKKHIVAGIEPTSHYWFNLYTELIAQGVTVVMVNGYAVNRIKEVDDNLQVKSDDKDPKVIAKLVRDGAYSVPYLPEGIYADLRGWFQLRERAVEVHTRLMNQLHRWAAIYFPEIENVGLDSSMVQEVLGKGYVPQDIVGLGKEGVLTILKEAKYRGCRDAKAKAIYEAAMNSIGYREGLDCARQEVRDLISDLQVQEARIAEYQGKMVDICRQIYPNFTKVEAIRGVSAESLSCLLADLGDMSRFDSCAEIVKISGLAPYISESGKYKGIPKVSKRGRKRMRHYLYLISTKIAMFDAGFNDYFVYLTAREKNPLKYKQAMMNLSTKFIRVLRHILMTGEAYDPEKLISESKKLGAPKARTASGSQA